MTKAQIIAELRRSACEDANPYAEITFVAWLAAFRMNLREKEEMTSLTPSDDLRMFYLIVAHALEDET